MAIQFEASRLCDYFPQQFRRHVRGTVVTVFEVEDAASGESKTASAVPTTELSAADRAQAGLGEKELWFRILQDPQVFGSAQELRGLAAALEGEIVSQFGLFKLLAAPFIESVGVIVFTRATQANMTFLCLYFGHLRSAVMFHSAIALHKSRQVELNKFSQTLKQQWVGEPDSRGRPTNPELWVDRHANVRNKDHLPLIFVGSSAHRIFPLIARDLWTGVGCKNVRALVWESFYVENLLKAYDKSIASEPDCLITAHGCSPFTLWFSEMIISSMIPLKDTERCVFDINEMMKTIRIEAAQTGGRVDSYLFELRFGKRVYHSVILSPAVDPDPYASMIGRLSPAFEHASQRVSMNKEPDKNQPPFQDAGIRKIKADLVSITNSFASAHFNELEFIEILRTTWLDPASLTTTLHLPLDVNTAISVMLLCQFLWLTIPTLREKAVVLVASANSTLMCNTTRLLIDALAPQIRDMFITTKTYLISTLLDGAKKRTNTTHYLESLTQFDEKIASLTCPFKLIISTPDTIEEGWSREIYLKYIHNDPAARLVHLKGPDTFKSILDVLPGASNVQNLRLIAASVVNNLSDVLTNTYFSEDVQAESAELQAPSVRTSEYDDSNMMTDGRPRVVRNALENIVKSTFDRIKSSTNVLSTERNHITSLTVWEEIPSKASTVLLDRAVHVSQLKLHFAADAKHACALSTNALQKFPDPVQFTKALLIAPYHYLEGQVPTLTPPLDSLQIPINVQGVGVLKVSMEPSRVILSSQPIVRPAARADEPNNSADATAADGEPAAPAASGEDDWLLGLLRGLGNAVQDLKNDKELDATGKKVSKRATEPDGSLNAGERLYCEEGRSAAERSLMIDNAPNGEFLVNSVYHRVLGALNFRKTEVPAVCVRCHAPGQCQGPSCKNLHHIKVTAQGFNFVQLGVVRELTRRRQV